MMSNELYDVYFVGVAEGKDAEQVKVEFSKLFRVDVNKVECFFSGTKKILKSKIDIETADKYIVRLARIGVVAKKVSLSVESSVDDITSNVESVDSPSEKSVIGSNSVSPAESEPIDDYSPASAMHQLVEPIYSPDVRRIAFEFTGKGFEYFKIWIVNVLLTIVTLGVYSAWAKVRNKQYFYGNTHLDNTSFEYTAEPLKILKGRAIAAVFLIAYFVLSRMSPVAGMLLGLTLFILMPWIIVNSLKFNARHSSYRNINFRFVGGISDAIKSFILWPIAAIFSMGLLFPFVWKKKAVFTTNNHLYGREPFNFDVSVKQYYKMLLVLLGAGILVLLVVKFFSGATLSSLSKDSIATAKSSLAMAPAIFAYIMFYLFVAAYFVSTKTNILFNNTTLKECCFESTWKVGSYAMLLFTNTLGIIVTAGLFIPFARVRAAAYKAEHTAVFVSGDLESFIVGEQEQASSLGEGAHDLFDVDISL